MSCQMYGVIMVFTLVKTLVFIVDIFGFSLSLKYFLFWWIFGSKGCYGIYLVIVSVWGIFEKGKVWLQYVCSQIYSDILV